MGGLQWKWNIDVLNHNYSNTVKVEIMQLHRWLGIIKPRATTCVCEWSNFKTERYKCEKNVVRLKWESEGIESEKIDINCSNFFPFLHFIQHSLVEYRFFCKFFISISALNVAKVSLWWMVVSLTCRISI